MELYQEGRFFSNNDLDSQKWKTYQDFQVYASNLLLILKCQSVEEICLIRTAQQNKLQTCAQQVLISKISDEVCRTLS